MTSIRNNNDYYLHIANVGANALSIPEGVKGAPGPSVSGLDSQPLTHFVTQDFELVRERMCQLFKPHQINPSGRSQKGGPFEMRYTAFQSGTLIADICYNRDVDIVAPLLEDFYVLQFTLSGSSVVKQGSSSITVRPGTVCIMNPTFSLSQKLDQHHRQVAVRISRVHLERAITSELGATLRRPLEFYLDAYPIQGNRATVARFVSNVWNELIREDTAYRTGSAQSTLDPTLANLMLTCFPHNYSEIFGRAGYTPAPLFVRLAEQYIRENASDRISLSDIAAAVGVSPRTLHNGFRDFRNTSPMAYLKEVRLARAHQELVHSWRSGKTVTDVALECGFNHLSKFAQNYKNRFGEAPSVTARRGHN